MFKFEDLLQHLTFVVGKANPIQDLMFLFLFEMSKKVTVCLWITHFGNSFTKKLLEYWKKFCHKKQIKIWHLFFAATFYVEAIHTAFLRWNLHFKRFSDLFLSLNVTIKRSMNKEWIQAASKIISTPYYLSNNLITIKEPPTPCFAFHWMQNVF